MTFNQKRVCSACTAGSNLSSPFVMLYAVKKEMPKFMEKPENVECVEFDDVHFATVVTGKPEPTVEWFVDLFSSLH